ncbi:MAG: hypothetical protein NXI23_21120 [Bacteroidetes bacterium]|jgi:hypothetical protein|nr:hypothetical protein [Bacteroidota bacterium]
MKSLFFVLFLPILLTAQRNTKQQAVMADLYPTEAVETYDLRTRTEIKRVFFNQEWLEGHLLFIDGKTSNENFPIKYDILNQELNVSVGNAIYAVPLSAKTHGFILKKVIGPEYEFRIRKIGKEVNPTIFEVAVKGKYQLFVKHYAEKIKPNYVAALDAGTRDEKAVVKELFYLLDNRGRLIEIPKKQKAAREVLGEYTSARRYLAKNKVNFKDRESLRELVLFMNNFQK